MNKAGALQTLNRHSTASRLSAENTHFANVNARKPVWWLDIPTDEIFDLREPVVNLVLAERDGRLHHLCVPKEWIRAKVEKFAIRKDKGVISLELSALDADRFTDVRPTSGRMRFAEFPVAY